MRVWSSCHKVQLKLKWSHERRRAGRRAPKLRSRRVRTEISGAIETACGHRIIRNHDRSQRPRSSVEWPVSFHRHDPVRDNKVDRNRGAEIEDALLTALPAENVLRPSISCTRHYTKHVLHAQSDPRPVMRFDLRSCNRLSGELPEALSGKVGFHSCSVPSEGTPTAVPIFHFPVLSAIVS